MENSGNCFSFQKLNENHYYENLKSLRDDPNTGLKFHIHASVHGNRVKVRVEIFQFLFLVVSQTWECPRSGLSFLTICPNLFFELHSDVQAPHPL